MDRAQDFSIFLKSEDETDRLARCFAPFLRHGDTILLEGPIGAGKTHFARALVRSRLGQAEDVPSPTFTLVQTYTAPGTEIWHADLYRLTGPDDVIELGLEEAFNSAICLIEWPDRLGPLTPKNAIRLSLTARDSGRQADISFGTRTALCAQVQAAWNDNG